MNALLSMLDVASGDQWIAALWFAVAIGLMDRFDISLPRGDSIGVSGALVAAGVLVAGIAPTTVLSVLALLVAHVGRSVQSPVRIRGAMVSRVSALTALWILSPFWVDQIDSAVVPVQWILAIPLVYLVFEALAAQAFLAWESGRPISRLLAGNYRRQGPLVAAQASASVLAAITYADMRAWSLVLVVALLLLMRQSLALLLEIRETYRTTVEVLVEAAEGQDERRRGHAERTAHLARSIATRMGLSPTDVERVSYASLLHDVDALAESVGSEPQALGQSASIFTGTAFFDDVIPVLRICDGRGLTEDVSEGNLLTAMIVALASDVDMTVNPAVSEAHSGSATRRVSAMVPLSVKAKVVSAAIELGYQIPAVT